MIKTDKQTRHFDHHTVQQINAKAGRNLPAAIAVAVVLGGLAALTLSFFHWGFIALVALFALQGLRELGQSFAAAGRQVALAPVAVGTLGILICAYQLGLEAMMAATLLTAGAALMWILLAEHNGEDTLRDATATVMTILYLPFLAGFVMLMLAETGPVAVAFFIMITIASDTGGYAAGVWFGRHPMSPSISPKKSWEGFIGSVLCATLVAWGATAALQIPGWWALLLGPAGALAATIGDLSESLLKRDLGVKDMGNLLPGHGGAMDRADSLVMVAPVCYLVFRLATSL